MTSNKFSAGHPLTKPPARCKSLKLELPPLIPIIGPAELQGYASWMDLPAEDHLNISMYVRMPRVDSSWIWSGQKTISTVRFVITLERIHDPNPWDLTIGVWRSPAAYESFTWPQFHMPIPDFWDTGLLTEVHVPGEDRLEAQVTA